MSSKLRDLAKLLTIGFAILAGPSCSGPSTFHDTADPPQATAHIFGVQPTSSSGADPVSAIVRSQGQVTMTGNASTGGNAAIGNFAWTQTDPSTSPQVQLLYLDSDTVTFTAPTVVQDTTLHFTLTVTTANNSTSTAHVVLVVKAANDSNQFLSFPATGIHHLRAAVATVEGLANNLSADVPICVVLNRTLEYTSRDRNVHDGSNPAFPPITLPAIKRDTAWNRSLGGVAGDFSSFTNPVVAFDLPLINQDDIAAVYGNPVSGTGSSAGATSTANLNAQLVPADIGLAKLALTVSASEGSCDGTLSSTELASKTLEVQVQDQLGAAVGAPATAAQPNTAVTSATFTPDDVVSQESGPYETADTARAYYDAIDPPGSALPKDTMNNWLTANCFDPTAPNYGVDPTSLTAAHATYTNNYDLGFGRDMYFALCTASSPAVIKGYAKVGDMAAIVINYASLEAAASKLNPIQAVAMEYSAAADGSSGSRRFAKFYVFAPDDRDGTFHRVLTANFDHRGEKYLPGTCIACHGGALPTFAANFSHTAGSTSTTYPTNPDPTKTGGAQLSVADLDAAFMAWDLDSFLYSDPTSDPTFVGLSVDRSLYTRAAQEPSLKKLNQLTYCTYQPEIEAVTDTTTHATVTIDRLQSSRRLVASWYGGAVAGDGTVAVDTSCATGAAPNAALLPGAYNDAGTAPGWTAKTAPNAAGATTLTSDQIYHQVFARNCRSCHVNNAKPLLQFSGFQTPRASDGYLDFVNEFAGTQPTDANLGKAYIFQQGRMPLARLTTDRFWVDYNNSLSAASVLAAHLQQITGETDLLRASADAPSGSAVPAGQEAVPPGQPVIALTVNGTAATTTNPLTGDFAAARFSGAKIDAIQSFFVGNYSWSLGISPSSCLNSANIAAENSCLTAVTPINPPPIVGTTSAAPGIDTTRHGFYELTLAAANGLGGTPTTSVFELNVPDLIPTLTNPLCPGNQQASYSTTANGTPISIVLAPCFSPAGDPPFTVMISYDNGSTYHSSIPDPTASNPAALQWNATVMAPGSQGGVPTIAFAFTQDATANAPSLLYQLCDFDNECATGTVNVALLTQFGVSDATFTAYVDPTTNPNFSSSTITVPASPAVAISAGSPSLSLAALNNSLNLDAPNFDLSFSNFSSGSLLESGSATTDLKGTAAQISSDVNSLVFTSSTPLTANCDLNGANCSAGTTFTDTLSYGASSKSAMVTVNVRALTSFNSASNSQPSLSSIYQIMQTPGQSGTTNAGSSCASGSCHGSGGAGAVFWTFVPNPSGKTTGASTTYSNISTLYTVGDPLHSELYTAPCQGSDTTMGNSFKETSTECQIIYQWILEGARF